MSHRLNMEKFGEKSFSYKSYSLWAVEQHAFLLRTPISISLAGLAITSLVWTISSLISAITTAITTAVWVSVFLSTLSRLLTSLFWRFLTLLLLFFKINFSY